MKNACCVQQLGIFRSPYSLSSPPSGWGSLQKSHCETRLRRHATGRENVGLQQTIFSLIFIVFSRSCCHRLRHGGAAGHGTRRSSGGYILKSVCKRVGAARRGSSRGSASGGQISGEQHMIHPAGPTHTFNLPLSIPTLVSCLGVGWWLPLGAEPSEGVEVGHWAFPVLSPFPPHHLSWPLVVGGALYGGCLVTDARFRCAEVRVPPLASELSEPLN